MVVYVIGPQAKLKKQADDHAKAVARLEGQLAAKDKCVALHCTAVQCGTVERGRIQRCYVMCGD